MKHKHTPIQEVLKVLTDNLNLQFIRAVTPLFTKWETIVGPEIAAVSQPQGVSSNTLRLTVENSAWAQQLTLLKPQILHKLNGVLDQNLIQIKDIRFKVQGQPFKTTKTPSAYKNASIRKVTFFTPKEDQIPDPSLRQVFSKFCRTYARAISSLDGQSDIES